MDLGFIEHLPAVRWIATAPGVYPVLSALHILAIALIVGPILLVDLRLIGIMTARGIEAALVPLARTAIIGFSLALPTGLALMSVQVGKYLTNGPFMLKMALIGLAGFNAIALRRAARPARWDVMVDTLAGRLAGLASLVLWLVILLAGRWIAFV